MTIFYFILLFNTHQVFINLFNNNINKFVLGIVNIINIYLMMAYIFCFCDLLIIIVVFFQTRFMIYLYHTILLY